MNNEINVESAIQREFESEEAARLTFANYIDSTIEYLLENGELPTEAA
jgi:hypothetical protein